MSPIRVLLADDHAVVREGLKALLNAEPGMEVIGEASDGLRTVALTTELDPDVVIVDISMPQLNGVQITNKLRESRPGRKVLALTVHEDNGYLRSMLEAGAAGYVLKRAAASELVQAIRAIAGGGTYIDPSLAAGMVDNFVHPRSMKETPTAELSERETDVVRLIALGYSNKEIASQLRVSVKTVETYKTRSMEKLGMHGRVDIVRYAVRRGWLASC